jgi:hypothetical protein
VQRACRRNGCNAGLGWVAALQSRLGRVRESDEAVLPPLLRLL